MNNARISIVTLGVSNLVAATQFYEALGWLKSDKSQDSISFLKGSNIVLGLYGAKDLADDIGIPFKPGGAGNRTLAINMRTRLEVDQFITQAEKAGGTIAKKPQEVFWGGYSGYFGDLDDHYWEVAHNPFIGFDADGNLDLDGDKAA